MVAVRSAWFEEVGGAPPGNKRECSGQGCNTSQAMPRAAMCLPMCKSMAEC